MIESIITKTGTRMRRAENGTGASSLAFGLILTATLGTLMGTMLGGSADAGAPIIGDAVSAVFQALADGALLALLIP